MVNRSDVEDVEEVDQSGGYAHGGQSPTCSNNLEETEPVASGGSEDDAETDLYYDY